MLLVFQVLFLLVVLLLVLKEPGLQSLINALNSLGAAISAFKAYKALGQGFRAARPYALMLLAFGFGGTFLYRLVYIDAAPNGVDFNNLLLYGVPVALMMYGAWREQPVLEEAGESSNRTAAESES